MINASYIEMAVAVLNGEIIGSGYARTQNILQNFG